MANLPPEALAAALAAVHGAGAKGSGQQNMPASQPGAPSAADAGMSSPSAQGGGQVPGNPTPDPTQDPNAQAGQDPNSQAVWSEFPATDPSQVQQLAQAADSTQPDQLVQLLASFMQQAQADQDKLSQMHEAMLSHLVDLLGAAGPTQGGQTEPAQQAPPQGPGVGGAGAGY